MDLQNIQAELDTYQGNEKLLFETNVAMRAQAMALIDLIDRIARTQRQRPEVCTLQQQAAVLRKRLDGIDRRLFQRVRQGIQTGQLSGQTLRSRLDQFTTYRPDHPHQPHMGYEALDLLLRGVLEVESPPLEQEPAHAEMVHFERTPARAILELVDRTQIGRNSVFYDLGAGLGHVAILVHLLTGCASVGVEIEPAYCTYARRCVQHLRLERVAFVQADAREVTYTAGHVFFMFTPFMGELLETVVEKLRQVARRKPIQVCTYGPCTRWLAQCSWLVPCDENFDHEFKLAIFQSSEQR